MAPRALVAGSGLELCLARTFGMSSSGLSVSTSSQRSLELDDKSDGLAVSENSRHGLLVRRAVVAVGGRVQEWAGINRGRGARGGNVLVVLAALAQPAPMPRKGQSLEWPPASGSDADLMGTSSAEVESSPCELECSGSSEEEPGGMSPAGQQGGLSPGSRGSLPHGQRGGVSAALLEFESGDMLAIVPRSAPRARLPSVF